MGGLPYGRATDLFSLQCGWWLRHVGPISLRPGAMPGLNPRTWYCAHSLVSQYVLPASWALRLGNGICTFPLSSGFGCLGLPFVPSILTSCDLGSSNSLTCASLPVLSFQLVALPEGNKKSLPKWRTMTISCLGIFCHIFTLTYVSFWF